MEEIIEGDVPLAEFIPPEKEEVELESNAIPLTNFAILSLRNTWSLINLGLIILTFLLWFSYDILGPGNIITGFAMLGNIVLYILTQDITGQVVWIDNWTWIFALLYAIG